MYELLMNYLEAYLKIVKKEYGKKAYEVFVSYIKALVYNFSMERPTSTIVYLQMMEDDATFNAILEPLVDSNIIISNIDFNYATSLLNVDKIKEILHLDDDKIQDIKMKSKSSHYKMRYHKNEIDNLVKINTSIKKTGLVRKGFMRAGSFKFEYNEKYIKEYAKYIAHNIYKKLSATTKDVKYEDVVAHLIEQYGNGGIYSLGENISDSRGRAIFNCTHLIFNPVSHKDARACLIAPVCYPTIKQLDHAYAAIAELLGYRGKNREDKVRYGKDMYILRTLPSLDKMIEDNDFEDLHVLIWLRRIYDNLDHWEEGWTVPIEIDATASMIQTEAVLLNSHELMDYTNLINPEEFKDAWSVDGVPRSLIKKACTPRLYGSCKEPKDLWLKHNLEFTQEHVNIVTEEIRSGRFSLPNSFKDFIIDNVQCQNEMKVKIWKERFTVYCNKFKFGVKEPETHFIYVSANGGCYRNVTIQVEKTPDIPNFKRYFVTLLLHNLDSQIANHICEDERINWIIPNHDAFTVNLDMVDYVREDFTNMMYEIYKNRKTILCNYFKSIGIPFTKRDCDNREEVTGFSGYCLK